MSLLPPRARAAALALGFVLPLLFQPGCGPAALEVDGYPRTHPNLWPRNWRSVKRRSSPKRGSEHGRSAPGRNRPTGPPPWSEPERAGKKGGDAPGDQEAVRAPDLDDMLEDIDSKMNKIRAAPRPARR